MGDKSYFFVRRYNSNYQVGITSPVSSTTSKSARPGELILNTLAVPSGITMNNLTTVPTPDTTTALYQLFELNSNFTQAHANSFVASIYTSTYAVSYGTDISFKGTGKTLANAATELVAADLSVEDFIKGEWLDGATDYTATQKALAKEQWTKFVAATRLETGDSAYLLNVRAQNTPSYNNYLDALMLFFWTMMFDNQVQIKAGFYPFDGGALYTICVDNDDAVTTDIATLLNSSTTELDGVADFFNASYNSVPLTKYNSALETVTSLSAEVTELEEELGRATGNITRTNWVDTLGYSQALDPESELGYFVYHGDAWNRLEGLYDTRTIRSEKHI